MPTTQQQTFQKNILPLFEYTRADWLTKAREIALRLTRENGFATVDMVRAECPPPEGVDPRCMGSIFLTGKRGPFIKVNMANSHRKACHGRPISIFKLKEKHNV